MELSLLLFDKLKAQFPEIELVSIVESPFQRDSIWVNIILQEDDDRDIALTELAGEISTDILMDYGYDIMISSATRAEAEKKAA
ncbi:MAG: hypothetical protein DRR08_15215 [Candidatus Parabeggiatoa sp. nov. 2]|nr:MAG: hypothetical protein B6247_15985 [Beggiatoa sp. 4572_84]RKZ58898.1 MAG: hypothetical protein DRR08_15215 [Gammaproteobacteria bacterium]